MRLITISLILGLTVGAAIADDTCFKNQAQRDKAVRAWDDTLRQESEQQQQYAQRQRGGDFFGQLKDAVRQQNRQQTSPLNPVNIQDCAQTPDIDDGNAMSQYTLGKEYLDSKEFPKALKWLLLSANQKNADAQYELGNMYFQGLGVAKNQKTGTNWHRKSAGQGHSLAQQTLGLTYQFGASVSVNHVAAYALYQFSELGGNALAQKLRSGLSASMSPQEIESADGLVVEMSKPGNFLKSLDKYISRSAKAKR